METDIGHVVIIAVYMEAYIAANKRNCWRNETRTFAQQLTMGHVEQIASPFIQNISSLSVECDDCAVFDWSEISLFKNVGGDIEGFGIPNTLCPMEHDHIVVHIKCHRWNRAESLRWRRPILYSAVIWEFSLSSFIDFLHFVQHETDKYLASVHLKTFVFWRTSMEQLELVHHQPS